MVWFKLSFPSVPFFFLLLGMIKGKKINWVGSFKDVSNDKSIIVKSFS